MPLSAKRDADIAPPAATAPVGILPPSGATAAAAAVAAVEAVARSGVAPNPTTVGRCITMPDDPNDGTDSL
jgi:hypothetical protein